MFFSGRYSVASRTAINPAFGSFNFSRSPINRGRADYAFDIWMSFILRHSSSIPQIILNSLLAFSPHPLYIFFMRLLGIDYGTKRVGIALSDEAGVFAYPYSVIKNSKNLTKEIIAICKKENVGKIILGESLDYKGKCNDIIRETDVLKRILEKETGLPVIYENEVLSSAEAERIQGKGEGLDASAAAIILRTYIDRNKKA